MDFLEQFAWQTWSMIAEMGAYLLLGFAISAILHRYLKQAWIERLMGRKGISSIIWGSVVGVPMPLCSCGVIPVTMSLRDKGASKGATVSFLTSTPQTGIDSFLATYGMLGPVFALYKIVVAFLSGIAIGLLVELFPGKSAAPKPKFAKVTPRFAPVTQAVPRPKPTPTFRDSLRYGFVTMPADLANALFLGFLIAGAIAAIAPEDLLSNIPGGAVSAIAIATVISVPLYICSTGSIPLALALIHTGLPIGAALVLLIAGPATNVATITTSRKVLGTRVTAIYVVGVVACSWIAAAVYQVFLDDGSLGVHAMEHEMGLPLWKHLGGAALIALLLFPKLKPLLSSHQSKQEIPIPLTKMKTATINVSGMNCSHCENSVNNGLAGLPGTARVVSVNRNTSTAVIEGETFDEGAIKQKLASLGFEFKGMTIA